jgi:hypothetical protein
VWPVDYYSCRWSLREYGRSQHNALHFEQLLAGVLCIIEPASMRLCRGIIQNQPATVGRATLGSRYDSTAPHAAGQSFSWPVWWWLDVQVQLLLCTFNSDRSQI